MKKQDILYQQVMKFKKKIAKQDKKIKKLKEILYEQRNQIERMLLITDDYRQLKTKHKIAKRQIKMLKESQESLMKEVKEQQDITNEALEKLYNQEEQMYAEKEITQNKMRNSFQEILDQDKQENQ